MQKIRNLEKKMRIFYRFKMILSFLLICCVLGTTLPTTAMATENVASDSGSKSMQKLSKAEIGRLLEKNPILYSDDIFEVEPSTSFPYETGSVKTNALQAATDRLNALRRIAGLPSVTLDSSLSDNAQYGAVLIASLGYLTHYPEQPDDMDDSFYTQASLATSSSNLHMSISSRSIATGDTLISSVDSFMDDSDYSNVARLGHRRWQLNPTLGKVGFGVATSNTHYGGYYKGVYVAEKVFDGSGSYVDYDFIGWPASGNFPNNLKAFTTTTAWSVTLNPLKYRIPSQSEIAVTLTRESDGETWTFSGYDYNATNIGEYFAVDTSGRGVANCIIFRPEGLVRYEGIYTVHIEGLKTRQGQSAELTYQVDFFDAANYKKYDDPFEFTSQYSSSWSGAIRQSDSDLIVTLNQISSDASPVVYLATYTTDGKMNNIFRLEGDTVGTITTYTTAIPTASYKLLVLDQANNFVPMIVAYNDS